MRSLVAWVTAFFTVLLGSRRELLFEIAALRQQLAVHTASGKKPKLYRSDRVFWVLLSRLVRDYVEFYNRARPSQAIDAIPDPYDELREPPEPVGRVVDLTVLGGVHHDYRRAA